MVIRMREIDITKWKEYKVSDLFETEKIGKKLQVPTGAYVAKKDLKEGIIPRITVSNVNNGVSGYYADINDMADYRTFKNFISVSFLGTVFYQKGKASLDMKVHCLKPKGIDLTNNIAWFLVSVIRKVIAYSTYSDQLSSTILPNLLIKLPSKINADKKYEPDWQYMEDYIKSIEKKVQFSSVQFSLSSKAEKENIDCQRWKEFLLGGANGLFYIKKGSRLTKADMKDGNIHFIGATSFNNGITNLISNNGKLHPKNTITVNYNGSVGEAFYQNDKFWASDDVNVLYPKFHMNKNIALFIIPLIKFAGLSYKFIDKWKLEDMENTTIYLPVDEKGNPDWIYMESYITQLKEKAIKRLNNIKSL